MTNLLVVDDESLVTDFLTFLLEREGYVIHAASNGKEALDIVDRVTPALIITDLMMPVMSGLALARALRERKASRQPPLILCTAVPDPVAEQERDLFAAILRKPYAPARLIELVARYAGVTPAGSVGNGESA
ncbi:response regulator [Paraburkholderia sp. 2C]|jgi:CheY-like chemotaxis protein